MKLLLVWKSNDETDIDNVIIPYALNAKQQGWFKEVTMLIWGASQGYIRDHKTIHDKLNMIKERSILLYACKICADSIDAENVLTQLGIRVEYTKKLLSDALKDDQTKGITI